MCYHVNQISNKYFLLSVSVLDVHSKSALIIRKTLIINLFIAFTCIEKSSKNFLSKIHCKYTSCLSINLLLTRLKYLRCLICQRSISHVFFYHFWCAFNKKCSLRKMFGNERSGNRSQTALALRNQYRSVKSLETMFGYAL